MSALSGFLKLEVAKYKDIDHILKKLEDDGEIQNVYGVFKSIFDNELQFTVGELMRIQEAKKEQIDIKRQCQNNLSLFKNNLVLIVEMIIEKALKNTLAENKIKSPEIHETTCFTEETMDPFSQPNSSQAVTHFDLTQSPSPNQQTNQSGSGQKKNSGNKSKATNKSNQREQPQTLNLSTVSASNIQDKKLNLSQISNNKFEASPISQILHSTNSPQGGNRSFLKDKSMTQNQTYYTPRTGNQSCNSLRNIGDSLNTSNSFVNSEFNHIRGSVKFSRSPRSRDNVDLSPGPGSYQTDRSSLRQTRPKMDKAMKVSWIDTVSKTESPGPYLYPSKHFLSK